MRDIKPYFKNQELHNTFQIVLATGDNDIILNYQLYDNPVQTQWQRNMLQSVDKQIVSKMYNKTKDIVLHELNGKLRVLGLEPITEPNHNILNDLHLKVENAESDLDVWNEINSLIHQLEGGLKNIIDASFAFQFDFKDRLEKIEIEEYHKLWLSGTCYFWGNLILGYDTIGKDWMNVMQDNDIEHIEGDIVKNQSRLNTETLASFRIQSYSDTNLANKFFKWYSSLDPKIKQKVPINDLNKLSLGRPLLGKIIIDKTFTDFNPVQSEWYVPNHACKLNWNREVLSKATGVKSFRFYDSDLAHDMIMQHSGLNGYT